MFICVAGGPGLCVLVSGRLSVLLGGPAFHCVVSDEQEDGFLEELYVSADRFFLESPTTERPSLGRR